MMKLRLMLPNQINQATKIPTLRWVFQLLTGINYLKISTEKQTQWTLLYEHHPASDALLKNLLEKIQTLLREYLHVFV